MYSDRFVMTSFYHCILLTNLIDKFLQIEVVWNIAFIIFFKVAFYFSVADYKYFIVYAHRLSKLVAHLSWEHMVLYDKNSYKSLKKISSFQLRV